MKWFDAIDSQSGLYSMMLHESLTHSLPEFETYSEFESLWLMMNKRCFKLKTVTSEKKLRELQPTYNADEFMFLLEASFTAAWSRKQQQQQQKIYSS